MTPPDKAVAVQPGSLPAVPVPAPDLTTSSRYLANVAELLRDLADTPDAPHLPKRLRECSTIIQRVAHGLEMAGAGRVVPPVRMQGTALAQAAIAEAAALAAAEEAVADACSPTDQRASHYDRHFDRDAFAAYLRGHPLGGAAVEVTQATFLTGGRTKQTILVEQRGARSLPHRFVIRQDWASGVTGTTVVSEFALLEQVCAAGIRAPAPLVLEPSPDILGAPFMLVERMPGTSVGDMFDPPSSRALAIQLAEQLALLHSIPITESGDSPAQFASKLDAMHKMQMDVGLPSRTIDAALDWLDRNTGIATAPMALLHNDLGFHNFLVEGDRLTAILDWELASIGHPAADLGYIKGFVRKMMPWDTFLAAYHDAGGPAVDSRTLQFYTLWSTIRVYGLVMQARAAVAASLVRDHEITLACADAGPKLISRVAEELETVLLDRK